MLTKKDFKKIAAILKHHFMTVKRFDEYACICNAFADYLTSKNPAFDKDKFIEACRDSS